MLKRSDGACVGESKFNARILADDRSEEVQICLYMTINAQNA